MRLGLELVRCSDGRSFSIFERKGRTIKLQGMDGSVQIGGERLSLGEASVPEIEEKTTTDGAVSYTSRYVFPQHGFTWQWEITKDDETIDVIARICNTGDQPLPVRMLIPLEFRRARGTGMSVGKNAGESRFFRWRRWDMRVELLSSEAGIHDSENVCHIYDPGSGTALLCGFVTLDRMLCSHRVTFREGEGIEAYEARCEFGEYLIQPGGELASERLRICAFTDPYEALEEWAGMIRAHYRPAFRNLPPVGWCGGGWIDAYSDREDCWEKVALDNARMIREKLKGFDVRYLWTSQHNLRDGIPGNWLNVDQEQIPSGLQGFFAALGKMGFIPGLWIAPFWFFSEADGLLEANLENLLRNRDGDPICERSGWEFFVGSEPGGGPKLHKYYLDGTHPKTEAFIQRIFERYRELGVGYYMLDFLGTKEDARLRDGSKTPLEAARSILEIIRESAGEDAHLQTAVASTPGFIGLINAARVGRDFGEGRPLFPPFACWNNATYPLHDLHFGNLHYFLQNVAASFFTHRMIYLNDFNLLTIDRPIPENHARIATTVFGLGGGSPLMLGDDYRRMDPSRLRMVKMCLPRTKGVPRPVDLFDNAHPDGYCHILKLPVETPWDSYLLVAVFSTDDDPYSTEVDFEGLGLDPEKPYRVFEFWNQEYVGTFRHHFHCSVPPTDCRLFRISRARRHPWLLSTDMHAQQGAVEITDLAWDDRTTELTGTVSRPAGESGNLFFLMPRGFRLLNHEGTWLMKEVRDMNVIIRKRVEFSENAETFVLRFEPRGTPYVSRPGWLPFSTEEEWLAHVKRCREPDDTRLID